MNIDILSHQILGAAFKVHSALGPGLLESAYEKVLGFEMQKRGLEVEFQKSIAIKYEEFIVEDGFRADIIVNDTIVLELKSVKNLEDIHAKQLLTYLRLADKKLGLLINFNAISLRDGIKRVVNNL